MENSGPPALWAIRMVRIFRFLSPALSSDEQAEHFRRFMTGDNLLNGVRIISKPSPRTGFLRLFKLDGLFERPCCPPRRRSANPRTRFLSPSLPRRALATALLYSPTEKSNRVDTRGTVVVSVSIETIPRRRAKRDLNANFVAPCAVLAKHFRTLASFLASWLRQVLMESCKFLSPQVLCLDFNRDLPTFS